MANDGLITIGIVPDDSQWTRTLRNLANNSSRMISQSINAHVQPLGRITGEASEFQKSLAASNARVVAFGASTGAIFAMRSAFRHLISSTIEVEKHLASINSLFQLGSKDLQQFSGRLFQIANDMSVPFKDAAKAAEEFAQLGLTAEETLKRTGAALALGRTSGMDFRAAVQSLNATMNSFAKESLNATEVVDKLSNVSAKFAVTSDDLAEGLKRVGASASDANITLDQTISLITAAQQVTARGGAVIGNAFKSIFTRMIRPEVLEDLEAVGVTVRNTEGRLLPLIQTLKNLSATYDKLPQAQRAFVAETVGGIYQINILKAVLRDLGTGASIYESAMDAAATATDMTNKRMEVLNSTISSQLIRTMNTLTQTASNIGKITFGQGMRSGIGSFENVAKNIGAFSDPSIRHDTGLERGLANLWQGALKGLGNFIKGPALQFAAFALLKLFQRLETFIVQSAKELVGVNRAEKERKAINEGIASWLGKQEGMLERILRGQLSINQAAQQYVESMKNAVASAATLSNISNSMGAIAIGQVKFAPQAAGGYIPNLEIQQAVRGGYQAGHVLNTTLRNGFQTIDVTANSAESRTRILQDGQAYDFINPPRFSKAGRRHEEDSIRLTGLNPYELPGSPIKASGFVPNLAVPPEVVETIHRMGIKPEDYLRHKGAKPSDLIDLPENLVTALVQRYSNDPRSLTAGLKALTRKGVLDMPRTAEGLYKFLAGFMLNKEAQAQGVFRDMTDKKSIQAFAETVMGKRAVFAASTMQAKASKVTLRPSDVQRALDLHSETLPFIAAYEGPHDLRPAKDRPDFSDVLEFQEAGGQAFKFRTKMPIYGHKTAFLEHFVPIRSWLKGRTKNDKEMAMSSFGKMFGDFFDYLMKGEAKAAGVRAGEDEDSPLDIYEPVQSIIDQTNIDASGIPVSALELKASVAGAKDSGKMLQKIFRTLAGEPGAGSNKKPALKGPVGFVPKLARSAAFDASIGGIGILDADYMRERGVSQETFESMVYAASASGKPVRIHYGPMTTGKTTAAAHIVQHSGGLGGPGGDYITSFDQIDSGAFKQFIINKTDAKNLDTGTFGFALASASQVRGFHSPFSTYAERREEMIRRLIERNRGQEAKHAKALTLSPEEWQEYGDNMEHLRKKLGDRFAMYDPQNPFASAGFVPNLAWPALPEYESSEIGGHVVRKTSLGVPNNYFDKRIQVHIARIIQLAKALNQKDLNARLKKLYGSEYGKKLGTLFTKLGDQHNLAYSSDSIYNNLKGWMGERFAARRLRETGVFKTIKKQPEKDRLDFVGFLGGDIGMADAESKFTGKIGRYDSLKRKFTKSPFRVHYLVGNNDTTTTTASGFIPNLAKKLGDGCYGEFIDLERVYSGTPIGKKVFKSCASKYDIKHEYTMAKALEERQDNVSQLFGFPRVIGSLQRALQRRAIGKEVVSGKTIIPEKLWDTRPYQAEQIYNETTKLGRIWTLTQEFQGLAHQQLKNAGINAGDFIGHPGNTLLNLTARKLFAKLAHDPRKWQLLKSRLYDNVRTQQQVASALARQGARLYAIDPGLFSFTNAAPQSLPWRRQEETLASGFVPNLAGLLYHNQLGIPDDVRQQLVKLANRSISIYSTGHARNAMLDDIRRYGTRVSPVPKTLTIDPSQVIEVERDATSRTFPGTTISKVVVRRPGKNGLDQVLAIGGGGEIRTVWHNESSDKHSTLNTSRYVTNFNQATDSKKAAKGFVPNLAFNIDRFGELLNEGINPYELYDVFGTAVWRIANNLQNEEEARTEYEHDVRIARTYTSSDNSDSTRYLVAMYQESARRNRRRIGTRGLVSGVQEGFREPRARTILSRMSPAQQRLARRMAIEIGKDYHETGRAQESNPYSYVYNLTNEYESRGRQARLAALEAAREAARREEHERRAQRYQRTRTATPTDDIAGVQSSRLIVSGNSSDLTLSGARGTDLHVGFLTRYANYNLETGTIEEETNPLISILKKIKKGEITSVSATIIGPKIPAIMRRLVQLAQEGKLPKGFGVDFTWSPANLELSAQRALTLLPRARGEREAAIRVGQTLYGKRDITGFMTQKDYEELQEAFAFFGHTKQQYNYFRYDKRFAWGHIPNLFDPIADALRRENQATGGHAKLTSHPLLKTPYNPLGLAAIDSRNQSSATEAISQHLMGGQTIGEVRRAHTARGFVPNLAGFGMSDSTNTGGIFSSTGIVNSILLGVLGNITSGPTKPPTDKGDKRLAEGKGIFATEADRAAAKLRILQKEFESFAEKLRKGETITAPAWARRPAKQQRPTPTSGAEAYLLSPLPPSIPRGKRQQYTPQQVSEFEQTFEKYKAGLGLERIIAEGEAKAELKQGIYKSRGMKLATAASLGGGVASQMADLAGPSWGAAVNEFTNSLTLAGQVLWTFPKMGGAITAASVTIGGLASAADVYMKGLHVSRMMFEAQTSKFEKTNSLLDALTASLSSYDAMIADSKVTYEAIQREQRRYAETIAQLSNAGENTQVIGRLSAASSNQERTAIILEEKNRLSREQELNAGFNTLKEYAGSRTFLFGASRSPLFGGINPFGYSNAGQKVALEQMVRGTATASIASMSDGLKDLLSDTDDASTFLRKLGEASKSSNQDISKSAKALYEHFMDLSKTSLAGKEGLNIPIGQVLAQLKLEKTLNTPQMKEATEALRARTAERNTLAESALNQAKFQQKLFINSGAAQAGVTLSLRALAGKEAAAGALVYGSMRQVRPGVQAPESVLQREAGMGLMRMKYGERTLAVYEGQTEAKRANAEYKSAIGKLEIDASRAISGTLKQGFEDKVRIAELARSAGKPEGGLPALGNVTNFDDFNFRLVESVNKGIAAIVKSGNLTRFRKASGEMDLEGFAAEIAQKGAPLGSPIMKGVYDFVHSSVGQEALETMLSYGNQLAETNSDYLQRIAAASIKTASVLEESNFKEMANYMGGIKNLLDRGSRRSMERNLTRGAVLMTSGRTSEARAFGASLFLRTLQEQNIPIDISGKTPLSRMIIAARETAVQNLADVQRRSIGRATSAVGRLTGQSTATAGMLELFSRAGTQTSRAAVTATFPIEDEKKMMEGMRDIGDATLRFNQNLDSSVEALKGFTKSLNITKDQLLRTVSGAMSIRKAVDKENQKDFKQVFGGVDSLVKKAMGGTNGPLDNIPQDTLTQKASLSTGSLVPSGLAMAAGLIGYGAFTSAPNSLLGRVVGKTASSVGNLARRGYGGIRGVFSRSATSQTEVANAVPPEVRKYIVTSQKDARIIARANKLFAEGKSVNDALTPRAIAEYNEALTRQGMSHTPATWKETAKAPSTLFSYQAVDIHNKQVSGTMRAASQTELINRLKQANYYPTKIKEVTPTPKVPIAKGTTLKTTAPKIKGRGKGAIVPLLVAGTATFMYGSREGRAGEAPAIEEETAPSTPVQFMPRPTESFVPNTINYSMMMSAGGASRLGAVGRGGVAGVLGLGAEYLGDKAFGQGGGAVAASLTSAGVMGYAMRNGISMPSYTIGGRTLGAATLGMKPWMYGALRGGAGMGISIASDYARQKVGERYGYHAGLQVGGLGNALGGAMMFGPAGTALGAAIYVGSEAYSINQKQKEGIAFGHSLEGDRMNLQAGRLLGKLSKGMSRGQVAKEAERLASELFSRKNELESKKLLDIESAKGVYGWMGSLVSRNAFTKKDERQLNLVREQQQRLGQALVSGSDERVVSILEDIALEMSRQNEELNRPETKGNGPLGSLPSINSSVKVEISVKDFDRIPSEINDTIVSPLAQQLAGLEMRVNELVNQVTPRPARVRQ